MDILVESICPCWYSGIGIVQCFSGKPASKVVCLCIRHPLRHRSGMFPAILFTTPVLVVMGIQVYGYILYQHRITMIRRRDPGHFGAPQTS